MVNAEETTPNFKILNRPIRNSIFALLVFTIVKFQPGSKSKVERTSHTQSCPFPTILEYDVKLSEKCCHDAYNVTYWPQTTDRTVKKSSHNGPSTSIFPESWSFFTTTFPLTTSWAYPGWVLQYRNYWIRQETTHEQKILCLIEYTHLYSAFIPCAINSVRRSVSKTSPSLK